MNSSMYVQMLMQLTGGVRGLRLLWRMMLAMILASIPSLAQLNEPSSTGGAPDSISTIAGASLTFDAPHSGDVLYVGERVRIEWRSMLNAPVRLTYTTDGGATWLDVAPNGAPLAAATRAYDWTVPNTPAESVRLKITDVERPRLTALAAPLVIRRAAVTLLSPNGGESFAPGVPVTVTWSGMNLAALTLDFSSDGGITWQTVARNIAPELESYTFTPPATVTSSAYVRLSDPSRQTVRDISDAGFSLARIAGVLDAVTGESGARLVGSFPNPFASRTEIRWTQSAGADVELRLYRRSGALAGGYDLGHRDAGEQRFELRADGLPTGLYLYELRLGATVLHGSLMIAR